MSSSPSSTPPSSAVWPTKITRRAGVAAARSVCEATLECDSRIDVQHPAGDDGPVEMAARVASAFFLARHTALAREHFGQPLGQRAHAGAGEDQAGVEPRDGFR